MTTAPEYVRLNPHNLPGIAHPLRVRLLGLLREDGPSTATRLAERTGQSSGATSYHLRQLAAYGFVSDVPDRGAGRERWWQAAHRGTTLDATQARGTLVEAEAYLQAVASAYADRVDRWLREVATLPPAWDQGTTLSDWRLRLRPEEAAQLLAELQTVIGSYRRDEPDAPAPEHAEPVVLQVQLLPFVRTPQ